MVVWTLSVTGLVATNVGVVLVSVLVAPVVLTVLVDTVTVVVTAGNGYLAVQKA